MSKKSNQEVKNQIKPVTGAIGTYANPGKMNPPAPKHGNPSSRGKQGNN